MEKAVAEKLYKPTKRKRGNRELMLDCIRRTVCLLDTTNHPKMLHVIHSLEENETTIAFATEPVLASLHDILTWQENTTRFGFPRPIEPVPCEYKPPPLVGEDKPDTPPKIKNYWFLEVEIRFGIMQIVDALGHLHYMMRKVHRNVSPQVIIVCKRGTWKLFGLDFIETVVSANPLDMIAVPAFSIKTPNVAQPFLDYMAPEAQINGKCNITSDMFSLGLVICRVFNQGRPLIKTHRNPLNYVKQTNVIVGQIKNILTRIPQPLHEILIRMLSNDTQARPTPLLIPLTKYFRHPECNCAFERCRSEQTIFVLQYLDMVETTKLDQRITFYTETLPDALPHVPMKFVWQNVWPTLQWEVRFGKAVGAVITPILWLAKRSTQKELDTEIMPTLRLIYCRNLLKNPHLAEASLSFLQNLHILLDITHTDEILSETVPLIVNGLDFSCSIPQQTAALEALNNCEKYIGDRTIRDHIVVKIKGVIEHNCYDVKVIDLMLRFYEKVLFRIHRHQVAEYVVPTLLVIRLQDPVIAGRIVKLYKIMITHQKFGLNAKLMAAKMLPIIAPQVVNPRLSKDQYTGMIEVLYLLLDQIDEIQRGVLAGKAPNASRIERPLWAFRQKFNADMIEDPPPFSIPSLQVYKERKIASAEEMARKASVSGPAQDPPSQSSVGNGIIKIGQWIFGSNNSNSKDNNFLRVASNVFPNRRLSDNTMLNPRSRDGAVPSCSSSPGGTVGTDGLPVRRHSSIGPQERRGSHLAPPSAHQNKGEGASGSNLSMPLAAPTAAQQKGEGTTGSYLSGPPAAPTAAHQNKGEGASGSSLSVPRAATAASQLFTGRT